MSAHGFFKCRKQSVHRFFNISTLALLMCFSVGSTTKAHAGYQLNTSQHLITLSPDGDYTTDALKALDYLLKRKDYETAWTVNFQPGKYYLKKPLYAVGLKNVNFASDPNNPATLIKASDFSTSEYLIYIRMGENIKVSGFKFYGNTMFKDGPTPVWTDQGIYFGSCKRVLIEQNSFYNFGNAAVRVTTSEKDPVTGVDSFDTTVDHNTFNNIYQISTTSNDQIHGATARYWFKNNQVYNLRGSVKFASRTPGAKEVHLLNNTINGGDNHGFEIDNYDDFEIVGNTLQNIQAIAINIYTNPRVPKGFNWGNNFTIDSNKIISCRRGIRFSPNASSDGYQPVPTNLVITNNELTGITETDPHVASISVVNGPVNGLQVKSNTFQNVKNQLYIGIGKQCSSVTNILNLANGKSL